MWYIVHDRYFFPEHSWCLSRVRCQLVSMSTPYHPRICSVANHCTASHRTPESFETGNPKFFMTHAENQNQNTKFLLTAFCLQTKFSTICKVICPTARKHNAKSMKHSNPEQLWSLPAMKCRFRCILLDSCARRSASRFVNTPQSSQRLGLAIKARTVPTIDFHLHLFALCVSSFCSLKRPSPKSTRPFWQRFLGHIHPWLHRSCRQSKPRTKQSGPSEFLKRFKAARVVKKLRRSS